MKINGCSYNFLCSMVYITSRMVLKTWLPRAEDISITCPSHHITQVKQRTNTYKRVKTNRNNNGTSSTHHPTLTALIQLNSDDICLILWTSNLTFQHRTKLGHTSDMKNTSKEMIKMRILMPPGGCTLF